MGKNIYDPALQHGMYGLLEGTDRQSNGNTFFVDSTNGSNTAGGTWGQSWDTPFATVNYAVSKCTTGAGDVILVAAAHVETITATSTASGAATGQFCIDKGDVSIIGMGRGTKRPKFTLTTAAAAGVKIVGTSPNVLIANIQFKTNYTGGTTAVIAASANCYGLTVENCMFYETANSKEALIAITLAALMEDVTIRGCYFHNIDGGTASGVIVTAGAAPRLKIYDNWFRGDWSGPVLDLDAAAVADLDVHDNVINNIDGGAGLVIGCHANGTGMIYDNVIHTTLESDEPIIAAKCLIARNKVTFAEGLSGGVSNIAPTRGSATKTYTNWTSATHTLFNIVGGPVIVTGLVGIVVATIKSASIDINLDLTPTAPGTDLVLGTIVAIDGDAVGTSYTMNSTFGNAVIITTAGALEHIIDNQFIAPVGKITFDGVGEEDGGGAIQWCLSYIALSPNAYVVPAPTD